MAEHQKRVQLLIDRGVGYRMKILEGVFRFAREAGDWILEGADFVPKSLKAISTSKPDGILVGLWDLELSRQLLRNRCPIVDVYDWHPSLKVSRVHVDNDAIGKRAANFFLDKGFKHFAFLGRPLLQFSNERRQAYESTLAEAGQSMFTAPDEAADVEVWSQQNPKRNETVLAGWLRSLPKPTAIFCANDGCAVLLTEICHSLHLGVPAHLSILGVDNDEMLCQLSTPPLSSIATNAQHVGYAAAGLLDRIMRGAKDEKRPIVIPTPAEVVERQSTDVTLVSDPDIAMAARYILAHASEPITIEQIADHVVIPSRALQRRFKQKIGRTVREEITRCRIERAKKLLTDSELSIPLIARRSGLESRERLWRTFRQQCGLSPNEYRQQHRLGGAHDPTPARPDA